MFSARRRASWRSRSRLRAGSVSLTLGKSSTPELATGETERRRLAGRGDGEFRGEPWSDLRSKIYIRCVQFERDVQPLPFPLVNKSFRDRGTGRTHLDIGGHVADLGRYNSVEPALQNEPDNGKTRNHGNFRNCCLSADIVEVPFAGHPTHMDELSQLASLIAYTRQWLLLR